jgi:hypothetical protein
VSEIDGTGNSRFIKSEGTVVKVNLAEEMAAYDRLPRALRDAFKQMPSDYTVKGVEKMLDKVRHVPNGAKLLGDILLADAKDSHREFMTADLGSVPEEEQPRRYRYE